MKERFDPMQVSSLLAMAAALTIASAATAQSGTEETPPAGAGLSDLDSLVEGLNDSAPAEDAVEPETQAPAESGEEPGASTEAPEDEPVAPPAADPADEDPAAEPEASPTEPAAAAPPAPPAPPLTRAEQAELERISERGRLLISIAQAGILATQDMLTRLSDPEGAGISGWIAEPQGNGMGVTFYSTGEDAPVAVYRASVLGGRVVSREIFLAEDRPPLTRIQARMAAARAATEALDHQPCSDQPFNVLVIPPASATAPIDVYQTTPATRGSFPLGGHFRSTVDEDGTVRDSRGFASACVPVQPPAAAAGQPPQPIGITHLLDPMPTEMHLFLAQMIGRPLLVVTGEPHRLWMVTNERIGELRS